VTNQSDTAPDREITQEDVSSEEHLEALDEVSSETHNTTSVQPETEVRRGNRRRKQPGRLKDYVL